MGGVVSDCSVVEAKSQKTIATFKFFGRSHAGLTVKEALEEALAMSEEDFLRKFLAKAK